MKKTISVTAFDFYDVKRSNPISIDLVKIKKNHKFTLKDVKYKISRVFTRKSISGKCVELKMIAYKIPNTTTKHIHVCPAKIQSMAKTNKSYIKRMEETYGKAIVEKMVEGRLTLLIPGKHAVCPECGVKFWKEKVEKIKPFVFLSHKGKKKLIKRK